MPMMISPATDGRRGENVGRTLAGWNLTVPSPVMFAPEAGETVEGMTTTTTTTTTITTITTIIIMEGAEMVVAAEVMSQMV